MRVLPDGASIGELIADELLRNKPAEEQTDEESAYRQENLSCDEIEDIEQRASKE